MLVVRACSVDLPGRHRTRYRDSQEPIPVRDLPNERPFGWSSPSELSIGDVNARDSLNKVSTDNFESMKQLTKLPFDP